MVYSFYNLFVIGAILRPICLVEILDRYASSFAFFFLVLSVVFTFIKHTKIGILNHCCILLLLC